MMGQPLPSLDVPVVKGMSGILALTAEEINDSPTNPCIRCGTCVTICPVVCLQWNVRLHPQDNLESAAKLGVMDCVSCGSCSWVLPIAHPAGALLQLRQGHVERPGSRAPQNERVKTLVEARIIRIEKVAEAKKAALAAKKPAATATAATAPAPASTPAATAEEKVNA